MPTFGQIARKILNLPEPKQMPSADAHAEAASPAGAVNPWEEAAAARRGQSGGNLPSQKSGHSPEKRRDSAAPWTTHDEKSFSAFARRFGRGALWAVVGLAAFTGVMDWFGPSDSPPPQKAPAESGPNYPTEEAQAVAARWARSYLTWDEADPDRREKLLASDMPSGTDAAIGWDGKGKQDVLAVQPGKVTAAHGKRARVRVDVLIQDPAKEVKSKKGKKTETQEGAEKWVGLDVPVISTGGRIVVTGAPGLVGLPSSGPAVPEAEGAETDQELSSRTNATVERFFSAYASGDIESETAPGAKIPPLPDGVKFDELNSWTVDEGSGADRFGTARVSWTMNGAQVEQSYRVELTRVSSTDAQRWQVADVHGGAE